MPNCMGIMYDNDVPDGDSCWVVVQGIAEVLLQDWAKVSDTQNGRADITNLLPPGGTIVALEDHLSEIGHCLESKTAGVDVLAKCMIHFL